MIWSTMLKSKAIFITCAFVITASIANAQTIGDIAAHQRAKAQSELKGESLDKPVQATAAIPVKAVPVVKPVPQKKFMVVATFDVDGEKKALINDQGSLGTYTVGQKITNYKIANVKSDSIYLHQACKKKKKCKTIKVNVGGGL